MAIVVTEACNGCRHTECVAVCPAGCFHADERMVYIDPDNCIECRACIPVCPVQAIFDEEDLPEALAPWVAINAARAPLLPALEDKLPPLAAGVA